MAGSPAVSIGMAVRNEEKHLASALESLLGQDFKEFELILSDNASTDRSEDICREYAARDARIRYVRQDRNLGMPENQNFVFGQARGEFFMWAAGHDLWKPDFIRKCVEVMKADESVVLCFPIICSTESYESPDPREDPHGCRLDTRGMGVSSRVSLVIWGMGSCGIIYGLHRTAALRKTGLFRRVICPDNLIIFELSLIGAMAFIPEPLFFLGGTPPARVSMADSMARYRRMFYPESRKYFRLWLTNWRLLYEHLAAVGRAPVRFNRKPVLLLIVLFGLLARRGKHMLHDLVEAAGLPRP
ncbi:glycosyltransferase family 2 protein [bacterium]|nr:glycosyltransferase family 2 protein [bacterium]